MENDMSCCRSLAVMVLRTAVNFCCACVMYLDRSGLFLHHLNVIPRGSTPSVSHIHPIFQILMGFTKNDAVYFHVPSSELCRSTMMSISSLIKGLLYMD